MQILKTVESRVSRLGGEKSQKKENSERKFKELDFECCVLSSELKPLHYLQYVCYAISREKNLQQFILFSNGFRTFYSGSLQHLSSQLFKQKNLLENLDETTKTAGHYSLILLESKLLLHIASEGL